MRRASVLFSGGIAVLSYVLQVFGDHRLSVTEMIALLALAFLLLAGYGLRAAVAGCARGYSTSRGCEVGLSTHAGIPYQSLVHLVDACTSGGTP